MLEITDIKKAFASKVILNGCSFCFEKGRIYLLIGTNGSGKTTLFNILSGFLKQDSGSVFLNGKCLDKLDPFQIRRQGMGRTFQDLRLIGELSVKENVMLAFPEQQGEKWWKVLLPNKKIRQEQKNLSDKAKNILSTCFLRDIADNKANEISYGQQKLLNLACCIAGNADVFLLDEPVAGVNPAYREKIAEIVKLQRQMGKTLLIIEHNADFIESVADEILFLHEGSIYHFSTYDDFRNDHHVKNAYV